MLLGLAWLLGVGGEVGGGGGGHGLVWFGLVSGSGDGDGDGCSDRFGVGCGGKE